MAEGRVKDSAARSRAGWLVLLMAVTVLAVGVLAWWDGQKESAAALEEFAQAQATLAASVANDLHERLRVLARDQPGLLARPDDVPKLLDSLHLQSVGRVERPAALRLFLRPPGRSNFVSSDYAEVRSEPLEIAIRKGVTTVRLSREEAEALGLPERTAMAGLAGVDGGRLGHWTVAIVASAQGVRDRELRAVDRIILAVILSAVLVVVFGGLALRIHRSEIQLSHELAVAELARAQEQKLDRLRQAATMLTLASGMAHELSTPLGVIVGRAEQLVDRAGADERARRASQAILEQAQRIQEVIRGFLGLARGTAPTLREVQPGSVVNGALALVEHRFAQAEVTLNPIVAPELPPVRGEPRLLEHALVNLLLNACDACSRGGHVVVQVERRDDLVEFSVTDDGAGIDSAIAAQIAEPFFTTKSTGTGLGLAVTNEIVRTHRGALSIGAAGHRGTRAVFQVPIAAAGEIHARA